MPQNLSRIARGLSLEDVGIIGNAANHMPQFVKKRGNLCWKCVSHVRVNLESAPAIAPEGAADDVLSHQNREPGEKWTVGVEQNGRAGSGSL